MKIQQKTLEKLRDLITHGTEYRSGPLLVDFFNSLGSRDIYAQGFPSRWKYVDQKLTEINGSAELDQCIKKLFSPVNFVGRNNDWIKLIVDFNEYLKFDGWKIIPETREIRFANADEKDFTLVTPTSELKEDEFLKKEFSEISLEKLGLDGVITDILNLRFGEIKKCIEAKVPLSVIFLCGSSLEGILLGMASKFPREFNHCKAAAKNMDGKVKPFHEWTLANFIDAAHEIGLLQEDVKKFSHALRHFRNYIHPYEQVSSQFTPTVHTARISWQVLKAAIHQILEQKIKTLEIA